ncbi:MAG TPA: hemolysin family protein [Candidatus Hydrogenedentes bacterium]|nr:hemolysin family protein [Candidatus Hydrogenedentota bacterium]HOT50394.1 hemolysin family protein [Candidatus Hydrogenedentota bacterium]HOV73840.1 hemolysin family protein [Candidatus Hydrogenedentota bacterium]HPC14937.1 hemolysin family protein [Candidatus Hydrogenedentota bacterium]HRT18801.1 hemolysin family protein [Candidatus Hydrogenedentota bacterium]
MSLFISFLVLLAALALQALFEGYEIGFISSNPISVRRLAEQERSERAARLLQWIETPDRLIATILVGANLMVVICTVVVSRMVETLVPVHLSEIVNNLISTLFLAPIMLIFVGIIPKSVFRTMPTRLSLAFLPAIQFFYRILAPVAIPFTWLVRGSLYLIGAEQRPIRPLVSSLEEVRDLVDESVGQGAIEPEEQEMIHSVIDLQDMTVKEIMVPRIAIQALPDTATRTELAKLFVETGRTRVAIYRETIDQIIGVVSAYALLRDEDPACEDIARFVKQVRHIPDTMKVGDLLREFKQHKQHMAIVTDEYGGTDGLVTIEDIVEEILGEIQDEYDNEESQIHKLGPNAYVVDARMPLEEAAKAIGIPIEDDEVETIGGWLMHIAGCIPAQGQVIEHERLRMTVLAGGASHVSRIRMELLPDSKPKTET